MNNPTKPKTIGRVPSHKFNLIEINFSSPPNQFPLGASISLLKDITKLNTSRNQNKAKKFENRELPPTWDQLTTTLRLLG